VTDQWGPITVQQVVSDDLAIVYPGTSLTERTQRVENVVLIQDLTYCEARVVIIAVSGHRRKFCGMGATVAKAVEAMRSEVETGLRS